MATEKTIVLFRADRRKHGEVTAVFPLFEENDRGDVTCYAHIGQHGACSRAWYYTTRLAKPSEYRKLAQELRRIGYRLDIRKRWPACKTGKPAR